MLINVLTGLAVSGSAAAAVCLLLRRAARGRLSARWEYRMVKLSLLFALVPLGQLLPWTGKLVRSLWRRGHGARRIGGSRPSRRHCGPACRFCSGGSYTGPCGDPLPAAPVAAAGPGRRVAGRGPAGCWYGGCGPVRR
ncbi:MAG: hypothetical protein V8R55_04180 [Dysosmobacter sp.]